MREATVTIVGRPNVGKSTLFNRLVGRKIALVDDTPGVTRDRREGQGKLGDITFKIVDTAGLDEAEAESLAGRMRAQTEAALIDADVILFMIDARAGITPLDSHFAEIARRSSRPVVLVANKAEGRIGEAGFFEAYGLGLGEPVAISAEHGDASPTSTRRCAGRGTSTARTSRTSRAARRATRPSSPTTTSCRGR